MRRRSLRALYIALVSATSFAAAEACGSFGTEKRTNEGGDGATPNGEGGGGSDGGAGDGAIDDGSVGRLDGADEAGDAGCLVLLDESFDAGFGAFAGLKTTPAGTKLDAGGGQLVAIVEPSSDSEAQVSVEFPDAVVNARVSITFVVTDLAKHPSNFTTSIIGCALHFDPDVEIRTRQTVDNIMRFQSLKNGATNSIDLGSVTSDVPAPIAFVYEVTWADGGVATRVGIDGGALSNKLITTSNTATFRLKCGVDEAQASAGASLKRSIDFVKVVRCPN
jgi:hypothetical protein